MTTRSILTASTLAAVLLGACGVVIYDTSSRVLILEPMQRIEFDSTSGAVEVYAFDRTAINLFYYLQGFESSLVDVGHTVDGDVLRAVIACVGDELCYANWYAEIPLGTGVEVRAAAGAVKLTGVDAKVEAVVGEGDFTGVGLASPAFDLEVESGAVALEWIVPPTAVTISVAAGDVALTLPTGAYNCDLSAPDGAVDMGDITCDPAAPGSLKISAQTGNITLLGTTAP